MVPQGNFESLNGTSSNGMAMFIKNIKGPLEKKRYQ